jgi:hypothetical protein
MKEARDSLYDQMLDKDYKFPSVEQLRQVTSQTQLLCKKYFNQYWNMCGKESAFLKAKRKMEKVGLEVLFSSSSLSFFVLMFCFIFCSGLKKKLLPMKRCRRSKISVKKKMPETMMLVITRFSWS